MSPEELQMMRQRMAEESAKLQARGRRDPREGTGNSGGWRSNEPAQTLDRSAAPPPMPGGRGAPATASDMGGAPDRGGPPKEYGVGDQSMADPNMGGDTFGNMMMQSPAGPLITAVREHRLARAMAQGKAEANPVQAGTFGEAIHRGQQPGGVPPSMTPQKDQEQADQQRQIAAQTIFNVDTRTGHYKPFLPGVQPESIAPHEVQMRINPDDPQTPTILATGKTADMKRLAGLQPILHPDVHIPQGQHGLAAKLGHEPTRRALIAHMNNKKRMAAQAPQPPQGVA